MPLFRQRLCRGLSAALFIAAAFAAHPLEGQTGSPLPDAPLQQMPSVDERDEALAREFKAIANPTASNSAVVAGVVQDKSGAIIPGALLLLQDVPGGDRAVLAGADGQFRIASLPMGSFTLQVSYPGFLVSSVPIVLKSGEVKTLPPSVLLVGFFSGVQVVASMHDVAEAQLKVQEQQRVLGIFPNFYVSYRPDAVPLAAGQKLKLAVLDIFDPGDFVAMGAIAGLEQANDSFHGYGQGAQGYARRFGASFADTAISTTMTGAVFPILLRQDPRYFWKGTGSKRIRAGYAVSRIVITRGDNGKPQPNFSGILGELSAAGLSNLYYPASDRNGAGLTLRNAGFGILSAAAMNLFQEFLSHEITPSAKKSGN